MSRRIGNERPLFNLPDVINPPTRRCIQINVPDDEQHLVIFAGLIRQLSDWYKWERDPLHQGTEIAKVWREVWESIDWSGDECMGCCPQPTNRRYNAEGQLEVSYDGGITWNVAPDADDRYSGATSPPLEGADGDEKQCLGASSAMEYVKQNLIDDLTEGATYANINAAIIAIVAATGVTGVGILIAGAAAAIFVAGVAAVQAAFTVGVWETFKCILYCAILPDASFDEAGWQEVKTEINSQLSGVAAVILYNWVNSVGLVGLTNSARSGFAVSSNCESCDPCDDICAEKWSVQTGTFNGIFDGWYRFTSASPAGRSILELITPDKDDCCVILEVREVTSLNPARLYIPCGQDRIPANLDPNWPVLACATFMSAALGAGNTTPFTVEIKWQDC